MGNYSEHTFLSRGIFVFSKAYALMESSLCKFFRMADRGLRSSMVIEEVRRIVF